VNRLADPLPQAPQAQTWPERNQRWLSQRLAFWRERIEQRTEGTNTETPPEAIGRLDAADFEPAALRLGALFGLSIFERELLILAAGVEIDAALRDTVARAQGVPPGQPVRLSFALALALLPQSHWDALSPSGPLRHWLLLEVDSRLGFAQAQLRIDERVLHYLTGVAAFDERLTGVARFDEGVPDASAADAAARIVGAIGELRQPLVMLADAVHDASRRRAGRALANQVFRRLSLRTLWVEAAAVGGDAREIADMARRIDREAALAPAGIALTMAPDADDAARAQRLIAGLRSPVVVLGPLSPLQLADLPARQPLRFSVPVVQAAPHGPLSLATERAAVRALQQFRVEPEVLDQALGSMTGLDDEATVESRLWDALRESARGGLDALAQRIESRATFDDLVVPPFVAAQLREMASQLRHRRKVYDEWGFGERHNRGLGIAALFAGETGTGKTLAAEAIANEARLDLYRIDLASVVSKYIGETEKNLSKLFDAAERSGAVLLFDEADALFGKRSEVKDSHDRYSNIEVAYLLQRIESYRGLAILTTNLKSALDRAFLRRIRFVVQFPFPDAAARSEIWRRSFPAQAPIAALDWAALAKLQLAGGNIRGIAVNAAFRAAERGASIEQADVIASARAEFSKLERPIGDNLGIPS
jgi:hypothetical protein